MTTFRRRLLLALIGVAAITATVMGLVAAALTRYHLTATNPHTGSAGTMEIHLLGILARAFLIAAGAGGLVAVGAGVVLSRRLARPLERLRHAVARITDGDYRQRLAASTTDAELAALARDVNRMADSLAETERLRRELVANVAHELRTPLTTIAGYLEAAEDGVFPLEGDDLALVRAETDRLRRLVDDLASLSRAESHASDLRPRPVEVDSFLRQATERFRSQADERGITLEGDAAEPLPAVLGDPALLAQVLDNLLANALHYTPRGGRVRLGAQAHDDTITMVVEDTGTGIPQQAIPHVFERFYRADPSRTRETGGTGIGLAIVKHLVERHDGDVWISSEPGAGTRVAFRLPVAPRRPTGSPPARGETTTPDRPRPASPSDLRGPERAEPRP